MVIPWKRQRWRQGYGNGDRNGNGTVSGNVNGNGNDNGNDITSRINDLDCCSLQAKHSQTGSPEFFCHYLYHNHHHLHHDTWVHQHDDCGGYFRMTHHQVRSASTLVYSLNAMYWHISLQGTQLHHLHHRHNHDNLHHHAHQGHHHHHDYDQPGLEVVGRSAGTPQAGQTWKNTFYNSAWIIHTRVRPIKSKRNHSFQQCRLDWDQ